MAETAQEVFSLHRMQKHEPVLRGVHGTYLFDIDKVGSWFIAVDDGAIHVRAASFMRPYAPSFVTGPSLRRLCLCRNREPALPIRAQTHP